MTSPVTPSSSTGDSPSIPLPSNETSPARPVTPQARSEADPPAKKPEDLCPDQDLGRVSREQGLSRTIEWMQARELEARAHQYTV